MSIREIAEPTAALVELRIRDLGVISDAVVHFGPGLTVLTGETGAGKTMVVTALTLLFGGRADASRVRPEAAQATIDGRLQLPSGHPALARVQDAGGVLDEDGSVTVRRTVAATGRSRAFVGGAPVPVGVLAEVGATVLAVHGQTDQARLTRPAEQRAALDRFAAALEPAFSGVAAGWASAYARWREVEGELRERRTHTQELRREADLLRHGLTEIDAAVLKQDEDLDLAARESRLAHLDSLREAAKSAHDALVGDVDDPLDRAADVVTLLGQARRALEHAVVGQSAEPAVLEFARRVAELGSAVSDVGADLSGYLADLDGEGADPLALARLQERRHLVSTLVRTYGDLDDDSSSGVAGVLRWATAARSRLERLDVSDGAMTALAAQVAAARRDAGAAAADLSRARARAAAELGAAVTAELHGLAMPSATVSVTVDPRIAASARSDPTTGPSVGGLRAVPSAAAGSGGATATLDVGGTALIPTADGVDEVEIVLRPHPDAPALPVHRGASGGELSRVMLGLEAVLAATEPVPLLVFDEVDAGVGGRAAVEVGARLARLGAHHQVLVVTHLAQVAAAGDAQVVVSRDAAGGVSRADVAPLTGDSRLAELARMLSGKDTPTARRHAEELLCNARASPAPAAPSRRSSQRRAPTP